MSLKTQRYRGEIRVPFQEHNRVHESGFKDKYDRRIILEFLSEIPIEKLKELVNFTEINPFNAGDGGDVETYQRLLEERSVEIRMEIYI